MTDPSTHQHSTTRPGTRSWSTDPRRMAILGSTVVAASLIVGLGVMAGNSGSDDPSSDVASGAAASPTLAAAVTSTSPVPDPSPSTTQSPSTTTSTVAVESALAATVPAGADVVPDPAGTDTTVPASTVPTTTAPASTTSTTVATTAPAPATTQPPAQPVDPEVIDMANAGTVTGSGTVTDAPEWVPPAPPVPDWNPVALDLLEGTPDEYATPPAPVDVDEQSGPVVIDQFVSNQPGCASDCIEKAKLYPRHFDPDLDFEIETSVTTHTRVWVLGEAPFQINGVPQVAGEMHAVESAGYQTEWSAILGDLEFSTTYHVVVRVTDQNGEENWAMTPWTTVDAPGPLDKTATGGPCAFQCITDGFIYPGDTYDTVDLVVTANTLVDFDIAISTSEPGWIGDSPILPKDEAFEVTENGGSAIRGTASGLQADTVYHVVVKATDGEGFTAHAIGSFRTDPLPPRVPGPSNVLVGFHRFDVHGDGDPGNLDRGEISFQWGFLEPYDYFGSRAQDKISSNSTIVLPKDTMTWVSVPNGGMLPNLIGNAIEQEYYVGNSSPCGTGQGLAVNPSFDMCDEQYTNVAQTGEQPMSWLDSLPLCSEYGITDFRHQAKCAVTNSPAQMGPDYVGFSMMVWYLVED